MRRPISESQLRAEFIDLARRMPRGVRVQLWFDPELSRTHARNSRRYAEQQGDRIFVAREIMFIPKAQRSGLLCHELGHLALRGQKHTERDADEAAEALLGVRIRYSKKWRGRGVQST